MAKNGYDWLKLDHGTRNDAAIRAMPLGQKAVFYGLLQVASEQSERDGSFSTANLRKLVLDVADGDQETYDAAVAHLLDYGILTQDGDTLSFSNWEKYQSVDASVSAAKAKNGRKGAEARWGKPMANAIACHEVPMAPMAKMPEQEQEGEKETEKEEKKPPTISLVSDALVHETVRVLATAGFKDTESNRIGVIEAIAEFPDQDPVAAARTNAEWAKRTGRTSTPGNFRTVMSRGNHKRKPRLMTSADPEATTLPPVPEDAPAAWKAVLEGMRQDSAMIAPCVAPGMTPYERFFLPVKALQRDDQLLLTCADDNAVIRKLHKDFNGRIQDFLVMAGYPAMVINFAEISEPVAI